MEDIHCIPDEISLALGGIAIALRAAHPGFHLTIEPRLQAFQSKLEPEVVFCLHNEPAPVPELGADHFASGKNWSVDAWQDKTVLRVRIPSIGPAYPSYAAVMNSTGEYGDIYQEDINGNEQKDSIPILETPLDEMLLIHLLARQRGLLLHAGAVCFEGNGILFAGTSGSGKSTLINLWKDVPGVKLLGDERISLRKREEAFWLYGTPWCSSASVASPEVAPLRAIFILKHATENQAVPLRQSIATTSLLVRSFAPFWDADGMTYTLQLLDELVQMVPCYELNFLPDLRVVEYLKWMISR